MKMQNRHTEQHDESKDHRHQALTKSGWGNR